MWVFKPENAWQSIHQGADIALLRVFKFIMTYVTPAYLLIIFTWWGYSEAIPILTLAKDPNGGLYSPEALPYILLARGIMILFVVVFAFLVRTAWKRNKYDDRKGFVEVGND